MNNYDASQLAEIRKGQELGLDTSAYENPELSELKMREIRWGLEKGVDVTKYNDPAYNVDQMEQIRLGLQEGLDVSRYAKPEINVMQMKAMRYALRATQRPSEFEGLTDAQIAEFKSSLPSEYSEEDLPKLLAVYKAMKGL